MTVALHRPPAAQRAGRPPRGRPWRMLLGAVAVAAVAGGAAVVAVPRWLHRGETRVCAGDALQARALDGLTAFAGWLERNQVPGYVGEVGWPAGEDWKQLATTWYDAADAIGLPVTAWAAASWPAGYPMAVYRRSTGSTALDTAGPQSAVVRDHPSTRRYQRGVVVAGGSFGASDSNPRYSNANPGRYGYDYSYENAAGYRYLADQGIRLVRLTVSWERLQRTPGGPLDPAELRRLRTALRLAGANGIGVVLDLHGYGTYASSRPLVLGTPALPVSRLADVWSKLATATRDESSVVGYDLLNEPITLAARGSGGARLWEQSSQAAVDAIRATGSRRTVAVTGYGQTGPAHLGELHPRAWIDDPVHRTVYEAHAYFDGDSSGHYAASYATELGRLPQGGRICRDLHDLTPSTPVFAAS